MSPRPLVRTIGASILWLIFVGPFAIMMVPESVHISGDAVATARELLAQSTLVRAGSVAMLSIATVEVVVSAALYLLFRDSSPFAASVAGASRMGMAALQAVAVLPLMAALYLAGSGADDLALVACELQSVGMALWQAFFGLHCVALGAAVVGSGWAPRWSGVLVGISGVAYLLQSTLLLGAPELAVALEAPLAVAAMLELPFYLWLMARGTAAASA